MDRRKWTRAAGARLTASRNGRGFNQTALAFRADIQQSQVSKLVTGVRSSISRAELSRLAAALSVTETYLLTGQ